MKLRSVTPADLTNIRPRSLVERLRRDRLGEPMEILQDDNRVALREPNADR